MRLNFLVFLWILWFVLVFFAPSSVYWRDSGEFIIQAFAQDISHPAGFPTYGMLSNLLALLPMGAIPWRVILLSCFSLIVAAIALSRIAAQLSPHSNCRVSSRVGVISLIASLILLPALLKQALSAEVYMLNAALLLIIAQLIIRALQSEDFRPLAAAGFIGGLALGNHVSALFSALPLLIFLLIISQPTRRSFVRLSLFTLIGLSVYAYLPLRASQALPLNTGAPYSLDRLWNVLSDARDRALRASTNDLTSFAGFEKLVANPLDNIAHDVGVLRGITPMIFFAITLIILAAGFKVKRQETVVLTLVAVGNYLFFSGWDGDPWIPSVMIFSLLATMLIVSLLTILPLRTYLASTLLIPIFALLYLFPTQDSIAQLFSLRRYTNPADSAERWLKGSSAPVVISENSWFLLRYLSDIEGVGDNRVIIYQPSLLFPSYFAPTILKLPSGEEFDSLTDAQSYGASSVEPSFGTLGRFIERVSFHAPLLIEPSAPLNTTLASIIRYNQFGRTEITRGVYDTPTEGLSTLISARLEPIVRDEQSASALIDIDSKNYFENILNSEIDLLRKQKKFTQAIDTLKLLCLPIDKDYCSLVSLNHLGLVYLETNNYQSAADLYLALIARNPQTYQAIQSNAQRAIRGLNPEAQHALPHPELVKSFL